MIMKKYLFLIALMFTAAAAVAQDKYFYVNLDVNKPLSNTEWISGTASKGLRAGYRSFINESRFSAGLDISWTTFDDYIPKVTIQDGNTTRTTDYYHYIYTYTAAVSGQYNFKLSNEKLIPYAGLGLGAQNNRYTSYYNIYTDDDQSWGFLMRPEAGILIKFGERRRLGAMAAVHFDYATNKSAMFNYNNFTSVGFQIGIMVMD
jgi:hypothetical protein